MLINDMPYNSLIFGEHITEVYRNVFLTVLVQVLFKKVNNYLSNGLHQISFYIYSGTRKTYNNWGLRGRVVKVADLRSQVPQCCRFEPHLG
jgi:hypothetical protein